MLARLTDGSRAPVSKDAAIKVGIERFKDFTAKKPIAGPELVVPPPRELVTEVVRIAGPLWRAGPNDSLPYTAGIGG